MFDSELRWQVGRKEEEVVAAYTAETGMIVQAAYLVVD